VTRIKLFKAVCKTLWGSQYRSEAALQLKISLRTMMRYDAGESPIPKDVVERLNQRLTDRADELESLSEKMFDHLREDAR
jgi:hypothetical protein